MSQIEKVVGFSNHLDVVVLNNILSKLNKKIDTASIGLSGYSGYSGSIGATGPAGTSGMSGYSGGPSLGDIDGGLSDSVFGGTEAIDGGGA